MAQMNADKYQPRKNAGKKNQTTGTRGPRGGQSRNQRINIKGDKGMEEMGGMNRYGDVPGWRIPSISSHLRIPFVVNVLEIFDTKNCGRCTDREWRCEFLARRTRF
jgi:hypothetical protein